MPLSEAVNGLPDTEDPVSRIHVEDAIEHLDKELIEPLLSSWRDHDQVSTRTLLVIIAPDSPRLGQARKNGIVTDEEYAAITASLAWTCNGGELYHMARHAGWGVATPYNSNLLRMDQWPVPLVQPTWHFAALCRAIK